jgi:hypothetical protein
VPGPYERVGVISSSSRADGIGSSSAGPVIDQLAGAVHVPEVAADLFELVGQDPTESGGADPTPGGKIGRVDAIQHGVGSGWPAGQLPEISPS